MPRIAVQGRCSQTRNSACLRRADHCPAACPPNSVRLPGSSRPRPASPDRHTSSSAQRGRGRPRTPRAAPRRHVGDGCDQVDDRSLSFVVPADAASVQVEQHDRKLPEVERDVVVDRAARTARNTADAAVRLYACVVYDAVRKIVRRGSIGCVQAAPRQERGKGIDVYYAEQPPVDGGVAAAGHEHAGWGSTRCDAVFTGEDVPKSGPASGVFESPRRRFADQRRPSEPEESGRCGSRRRPCRVSLPAGPGTRVRQSVGDRVTPACSLLGSPRGCRRAARTRARGSRLRSSIRPRRWGRRRRRRLQ